MIIQLKKIGTTLILKQAGKNALVAFESVLRSVSENGKVESILKALLLLFLIGAMNS